MKNYSRLPAIISLVILLCCSSEADCQKYYINVGTGYGFPAAGQTIADNVSLNYHVPDGLSNAYDSTFSDECVKGSLGKGFNFSAALGYNFSENMSAELGISYLYGTKTSATYDYKEQDFYGLNAITYIQNATTDFSARMLRIVPAIKMQVGQGAVKPYFKAGLVIGLIPSIQVDFNSDQKADLAHPFITVDTIVNETIKYSQGGSMGFSAAFGVEIKTKAGYSFYGELGMIGQTWAPGRSEVTVYTKNGANVLPKMTTYERTTEYYDQHTSSGSNSASLNQGVPRQRLRVTWPFSSWGINIGVHIPFISHAVKPG